jgi:hypothetical protein
VANFFDGQAIWQVTWTDDFNPIVKQFIDGRTIDPILRLDPQNEEFMAVAFFGRSA